MKNPTPRKTREAPADVRPEFPSAADSRGKRGVNEIDKQSAGSPTATREEEIRKKHTRSGRRK